MKKIALVLPEAGPVPAVKGGAIEELLTILVEQNEIGTPGTVYGILCGQ